jgi:hypothetical protein
LRAHPLETDSELAFVGLSELLRLILGLMDRIPGPQKSALSGSLARGADGAGRPFRGRCGDTQPVGGRAEESPVVAVVDDAHWLNTHRGMAVLFAGRRLERKRAPTVGDA